MTEPDAELPQGLGDELAALFLRMTGAGLDQGPAERIAATRLLLHLVAVGGRDREQPSCLSDYRHELTPLLARSGEDQQLILSLMTPARSDTTVVFPPESRSIREVIGLIALLVTLVAAYFLFLHYSSKHAPATKTPTTASTIASPQDFVPVNETDRQPITEQALVPARDIAPPALARLRLAAAGYHGLPTLAELAHDLAPTAPQPMLAEEYLRRLRAFLSLPPHQPLRLDLYPDDPGLEGRLATAIASIETPGNEPLLTKLTAAFQTPPASVRLANALSKGAAPVADNAIEAAKKLHADPNFSKRDVGVTITAGFGVKIDPFRGTSTMHPGVDLAAQYGMPVYATTPGVVIFTGRSGGYGNLVRVRHDDGGETRYAHFSRIEARQGTRISEGDRIGWVGATGRVNGPALHYELWKGGQAINPASSLLKPGVIGPFDETGVATLDDASIARALAAAHPDWAPRNAPWLPPDGGYQPTPAWLAVLVAIAASLCFLPWMTGAARRRKAYLRRRTPLSSPLRTALFRSLLRAPNDLQLYRRVTRALQRRQRRERRALDVRATIAATLRAAEGRIVPVFQRLQSRPEYLVLIEREHARDQQAERLNDLFEPLKGIVPVDRFSYQADPSFVDPEEGGPAIRIEQLLASRRHHRLLVVGSGERFRDWMTGDLLPSVKRLAGWTRRAMLSTIEAREWGIDEQELAEELRIPIGRASADGLAAIAEELTTSRDDPRPLLVTEGDRDCRPLPPRLRSDAARFTASTAPPPAEVKALIAELRAYLDADGFDWLCSLAVYPALDYSLTQFLGQLLRDSTPAPDNRGLFGHARLAAITQLPWLREGAMPGWLRRALITSLSPARSEEVRRLLLGLISEAASSTPEVKAGGGATMGIEAEYPDPSNLFEDEVLLDFLSRGSVEDMALPSVSSVSKSRPRRSLLGRIGLSEGAAAVLALLYAFAGWWVTPAPHDGAPLAATWLPMVILLIAALVIPVATAIAQPLLAGRGGLPRPVLLVAQAIPHLVAFATLIAALLLSVAERGAHIVLQPPGAVTAIVATGDGLIAILQPDGKTIRVFDSDNPEAVLLEARPRLGERDHRFLSLAVARSGAGAPVILAAVTDANGVFWSDFTGNWFSVHVLGSASVHASPLVAIDGDGAVVYSEGGSPDALRLNGKRLLRTTLSRVTALAGLGGGRFGYGLADGSVGAVSADALLPVLPHHAYAPAKPHLAGRIQRLVVGQPVRAEPPSFLAVDDNGNALQAILLPDRLEVKAGADRPSFASPPLVPWATEILPPMPDVKPTNPVDKVGPVAPKWSLTWAGETYLPTGSRPDTNSPVVFYTDSLRHAYFEILPQAAGPDPSAAPALNASQDELPPVFRGRISYLGNYTGMVVNSKPTTVDKDCKGCPEKLGGSLAVVLEFDGEVLRGTFRGSGGIRNSELIGRRVGNRCRLFDPTDGSVWSGTCDAQNFAGSVRSRSDSAVQINLNYEALGTEFEDFSAAERARLSELQGTRQAQYQSAAVLRYRVALNPKGGLLKIRGNVDGAVASVRTVITTIAGKVVRRSVTDALPRNTFSFSYPRGATSAVVQIELNGISGKVSGSFNAVQ